jgi:hypothetical protein
MSTGKDDKDQMGQDRQVELWKVKKLIKSLQQARGLVFAYNDYS